MRSHSGVDGSRTLDPWTPPGIWRAPSATASPDCIGGAFRAFGDAVQGVFGVLQSLLPGLWLPIVAIALVLLVGWSLIKR